MKDADPRTIEAARRGEEWAFDELVRSYQADVFRFCAGMLRDVTLAEDVAQEVFVKAFRHIGGYRGSSRFSTWLLSIARNCVFDELRKSARRDRLDERLQHERRGPGSGDISAALEVREALASLTDRLREPVLLVDVFGMTYRDVAQVMRVPIGTVKSRVHQGRLALVALLTDTPDADVGDV